MLQEYPEQLGTPAATPEADHLFMVWDEGEKQYLPYEKEQNFHFTVVQLLLISYRARQDI